MPNRRCGWVDELFKAAERKSDKVDELIDSALVAGVGGYGANRALSYRSKLLEQAAKRSSWSRWLSKAHDAVCKVPILGKGVPHLLPDDFFNFGELTGAFSKYHNRQGLRELRNAKILGGLGVASGLAGGYGALRGIGHMVRGD